MLELPCAVPLRQFVTALGAFEPPVSAEPLSLGLRFRTPAGAVFCEISVFSELFLVRVGGDAMEFRVRTPEAARPISRACFSGKRIALPPRVARKI